MVAKVDVELRLQRRAQRRRDQHARLPAFVAICVREHGDDREFRVINGESYYRLDERERVTIDLKQASSNAQVYRFELPRPASSWGVSFRGGTLAPCTAAKIKKQEDDVYTVYFTSA